MTTPIKESTLRNISGEAGYEKMTQLGDAISSAAAFREEKRNNAKTRQLRDMQMAGMQLDQQKAGLDIEMALEKQDEYFRDKGKRQLQREEDMAALKDQSRDRRVESAITSSSNEDSISYIKAMKRKGDLTSEAYTELESMPFKERTQFLADNRYKYDEDFLKQLALKKAEASLKVSSYKPKYEGTSTSAKTIQAKVASIPRQWGGTKDYAQALSDEQATTLASGSRGLLQDYADKMQVTQDDIDTLMVEEYKKYYDEVDENRAWYTKGFEPKINAEEIRRRVDERLNDFYIQSQGMTKGSDNVVDDNIPEGMKGFDLQAMSRDTGKSIPQLVQEWQDAQ